MVLPLPVLVPLEPLLRLARSPLLLLAPVPVVLALALVPGPVPCPLLMPLLPPPPPLPPLPLPVVPVVLVRPPRRRLQPCCKHTPCRMCVYAHAPASGYTDTMPRVCSCHENNGFNQASKQPSNQASKRGRVDPQIPQPWWWRVVCGIWHFCKRDVAI